MAGLRIVALTLLTAICVSALPFLASPAPEHVAALQRLRTVDPSFVIGWSADPRPPGNVPGSVNELKKQILALDPNDREATLFLLRSHGRDALHQRGVTDAEIGAPLYPIDYKIAWVTLPEGFVNPTPTPERPPARAARSSVTSLIIS